MRSVAILTGPSTHLDHLGVLSSLIDIPLIVTDQALYDCAQRFYPDLKPQLKYLDELTLEYLSHHYDTIFETGKFFASELKPFMQLLFKKQMRFVFCPHGNSDKGHSLQHHVDQDVSLIYGDHLKELLEKNGAAQKIGRLARTGNYRYPYYLKHRPFFDALAEKEVFSHFQEEKPVILYAPTWSDRENPSSFFEAIDRLIEELSPQYNLLVKLHPLLIEDHPAHTFAVLARYENHPSAYFLTEFPPIYPLLARCAMYIGDYSSIGYDFLAFDRPLYFIQPKQGFTESPLNRCGIPLPSNQRLRSFMDETWEHSVKVLSPERKNLYRCAFGEPIPLEDVRKEIFESINN